MENDFDGFMNKLKGDNKDDGDFSDVDDELEALEREVNNEPKTENKNKKKDDDQDSGKSGDEEKKKKGQKAVPVQPVKAKKEEIAQQVSKSPPKEKKVEPDKYLEMTEKIYHNCDKMKSMGVLEAEKVVCDEIIKYKKQNGFDNYDIWESKKVLIDANSNKIQNMVENDILDIEEYKKTIQDELNFCNKLLEYTKKDKKLQPQEIEGITTRLKNRIKIIEDELSEQVDPEKEEPSEPQPPKEEVKNIAKVESLKDVPKKEVSVEVPKNIKVNEKLLNVLNTRLEEYKETYKYFKEHYCEEQMQKSLVDIKELVLAIKSVEAGKDKDVDEFSLPLDITPQYICGCSSKDRIQKYRDITTELSSQKNEIAKQMNQIAEKLKTLSKSDFKKIQDSAKKDLDAKKAKIDKYDKIIKLLLENAKNPWIPAPLFSKVDEEEKIEKINDSIKENTMVIYFGKTNIDDPKLYLNVIFNYSEKTKTELVYPKTKDNFDAKLEWTVEKNEFKYLHRKEIEIQFLHKSFLSSKNIGVLKVKLSDLKSKCEKKGTYNVEVPEKKKVAKTLTIEININLRTPFAEREYDTKIKQVFSVTKIFPPFKGEGSNHSNLLDHKTVPYDAPINKITSQSNQQIDTKVKSQPAQSSQVKSNVPQQTNKAKVSKSLFSENELENPDYIDNLNSVEVLSYKEKELDEKIKKIEGRTPRHIRDQHLKIRCKKKVLEEQLGEGAITPGSYMEIIKKQYQHDKQLYDYFVQENQNDKASMVAVRLKLLLKETNEMIEYLKQNPE